MGADSVLRRIDTSLIYPPLLEDIWYVLEACERRGAIYVATLGFRTYDEQNQLFAKGRTLPGPKVTRARAGESQHNFGLAVDFCRDKEPELPGLQPWWDKDAYKILVEEVNNVGLHSGAGYADAPHVGWNKFIGNDTLPSLRVLHRDWLDGIKAGLTAKERLAIAWRTVDGK